MYPLISAGMNWYEAHHVCEFILDGERELRITSQPNGTRGIQSCT